jgi:hypothetical protein
MWNGMEFSNCVNAKLKMNRYNEETVKGFKHWSTEENEDLENYYII